MGGNDIALIMDDDLFVVEKEVENDVPGSKS